MNDDKGPLLGALLRFAHQSILRQILKGLAEAGFDACCGGVHALEHAARAHGKNLGELLRRLQAAVVASA